MVLGRKSRWRTKFPAPRAAPASLDTPPPPRLLPDPPALPEVDPPCQPQPSPHKPQPSPIPRTRTSIHRSDSKDQTEGEAPPRPSVKKRTSINLKGDKNQTSSSTSVGGRSGGGGGGKGGGEKEKGGAAKVVVERQGHLQKKKVQTVHARQVPHPPRQLAEALDGSGLSSQEEDVFSDDPNPEPSHGRSECWGRSGGPRGSLGGSGGSRGSLGGSGSRSDVGSAAGERDRSFSSSGGSLSLPPVSTDSGSPSAPVSIPQSSWRQQQQEQERGWQRALCGSRSSLDDSALQLAAERSEDLGAGFGSSPGYSTGSLRTRRSLRMRNLMEVFERCAGEATAASSEDVSGGEGGGRRKGQRSDSTSGSTTISVGSQEREDTDDELFQPPRRSRSRERGGKAGSGERGSKEGSGERGVKGGSGERGGKGRQPSQSPTLRRAAGRGDDSLRRRRASPVNRAESNHQREERGADAGRPPRHRNASRGRTQSESSTSESDTAARGLALRDKAHKERAGSAEEEGRETDKRGSIKELRQLFEKPDQGGDSGSEVSPPLRRSFRTRSVSPAPPDCAAAAAPPTMRRSMEIPPSSSASLLRQRDGHLASQPLRLGPKPFYGANK